MKGEIKTLYKNALLKRERERDQQHCTVITKIIHKKLNCLLRLINKTCFFINSLYF